MVQLWEGRQKDKWERAILYPWALLVYVIFLHPQWAVICSCWDGNIVVVSYLSMNEVKAIPNQSLPKQTNHVSYKGRSWLGSHPPIWFCSTKRHKINCLQMPHPYIGPKLSMILWEIQAKTRYPSRHCPDFHRPQSQITIDSPDFHLRLSQNCLLGYVETCLSCFLIIPMWNEERCWIRCILYVAYQYSWCLGFHQCLDFSCNASWGASIILCAHHCSAVAIFTTWPYLPLIW